MVRVEELKIEREDLFWWILILRHTQALLIVGESGSPTSL